MSIRTFLKGKFNIRSVHLIDIQCLLSMCVRVGWPASHNKRKLNQYVFETALVESVAWMIVKKAN